MVICNSCKQCIDVTVYIQLPLVENDDGGAVLFCAPSMCEGAQTHG